MVVSELVELLEEIAPSKDALEWDNVGLLVGDRDWKVTKVYIALDATDEVIDHAIEKGADMIITHHPLIFSKMNRVVANDFIGRRVIKLIEHHIAYYAMHTNFDIHGMGELAEKRLGLSHTIALDPCEIDGEVDVNTGIGRLGSLLDETVTLKEYALRVKEAFRLPYVQVFGDENQVIGTVAISPGSGKSEIDQAIRFGADVLVTGDIDHHSGIDAVARNLSIIDAGHYGIEHIFIEHIAMYLKGKTAIDIFEEPISMPYWLG
ncbi:MAG: Nif3-like dinuclear metal center hexameric protein [Lachnospiraceae bacterium]|nr:Nif3-like dinuclear metal center hexameric protein [Lachnospiraceae bacterium]